MSQHRFNTSLEDRPVQILAGWDRPLQGYFAVVEWLDEPHGDACLYSNLDDPLLEHCCGLPGSMDYFVAKLAEFGLRMPETMLLEIRRDGALNAGNRVVNHTPGAQA